MSDSSQKQPKDIVLIAGSRDFPKADLVREWIEYRMDLVPGTSKVISGAARGVDRIAAAYAKRLGYPVKEFPADWDKYGKAAGMKRNAVMVKIATRAFVFWDCKSRGTLHTMELTWEAKKPMTVITPYGEAIFYDGEEQVDIT